MERITAYTFREEEMKVIQHCLQFTKKEGRGVTEECKAIIDDLIKGMESHRQEIMDEDFLLKKN